MATISTSFAISQTSRFYYHPLITLKPSISSKPFPATFPAIQKRISPEFYGKPWESRVRVSGVKASIDMTSDIRPGGIVESDKLPSDVRKRAMEAVDACGGRVTIGDVASRAGLKLNEAQKALQALAADTNGFLEVSDEGDVLYVFPKDYRSKLAAKSFWIKFEPLIEKSKAAAEYLVRVSFGTALIASIVLVYTTIIALLSSRSEEDNRGRRGGRSYDSGFTFYFSPTDLFWYWDPYYYRRRRRLQSEDNKMNFIESIFSFVFGDGDPNQGIEEERSPPHTLSLSLSLEVSSNPIMERAVLLRSLNCSTLVSSRLFFRSSHRLALSSSLIPRKSNLIRRSLLRRQWKLLNASPSPSSSRSLQFRKQFSSIATRAVAAPPARSSPEFAEVSDEVAEKLGFEKVTEQVIGECKSKAVLFRHKKTGAEVMSVSNDDENKVFGIVFRTPPNDSTGIPHILEHSVLCGSRKYPVKEPFVELLKGSLHTFLNAFTYPDRTCYPVASTNIKDFYNLVDVYLDAVFFPKCVEDIQTFQQEGWHYELNNPVEDISYKGVVFNEMKGVYSQPDNILGRSAQQALFPDNTYGVDSGGDPQVIPTLTFEEFKEFHRKFYHPGNARIWFYGDDDPVERLRILSEYLDMFDASSASNQSKVEPQRLFSEPKRIVEKYPAGEGGDLKKKHMVCVNWLLSDKPLDLETELALGFLDHLMLGTPASPLRKILLESGLGDAIVGGGIEDELLQPQFSIGLKGVLDDDIPKVEELVLNTLKKLAEEGFDSDAVEASMNTIEFSLRENNTGSFPRGLSLMLRSIGKWIYDMDPFEPLKYEEPLKALKARIAAEGPKAVFSPLIEKFILNNPHRVTIEMQPDPEKASRDEEVEKEILQKVKESMTEEDLAELARATQELRLKQETPDPPEALRCVPSLCLQDIPKEPLRVPTEIGNVNGVTVLQHELFTNDVLYSEVVFDMSFLKQELLPLVPLFCQSLLEMGTKDLTFVQLNQLIGRKTGGISVYPFTSSVRGNDKPCSHMIVRGKAMAGCAEDLFNLMNCILQEVQFTDQQRFKQFVSQSKARMENRLRGSGHGIAAARMDAKLNVAGWIAEQMGGLSYLEFLHTLEERVDRDWEEIASSLEEIRQSLLSRKHCIVNITADGKNLTKSEKFIGKFLDLLANQSANKSCSWNARLSLENEAILVPTQVNYVGKAANIYETGYQLNGSAYVISKFIGNTWLWDRVRVSGGAYGGFCDFDTHSGVFSFLSYRDPNLLKTLDVYDGTVDFLRGLEMDEDTLTKAIIGTIGDIDSYQLPDAKGYTSLLRYLLGITEEERQRRREEILSTSLKDFKDFAEAIDAVKDKGVVVAVASPDDVETANKERPNFFQVKKAL